VSGFIQLVPGLLAVLGARRLLTARAALAGLAAGEAVVTWLTLAEVDVRHVNAGLVGLAVNVAVALLVHLLFPHPAPAPHRAPAPDPHRASATPDPGPRTATATAAPRSDESPRG